MEQHAVSRLERNIEQSLVDVFVQMGVKHLPLLPSQRTMHLMAKAAVTVYEAAVENCREDD